MMLSKPLSIKKGCYTCRRLDNVDMHLYAKYYQNIPRDSRAMSIFTQWPRTDRQTIVQTQGSCNISIHRYKSIYLTIDKQRRDWSATLIRSFFWKWPRAVGNGLIPLGESGCWSGIFFLHKWAVTRDFQQCGILTCVDSDEPVQPPLKLRNSKWCSVSSLTVIEYSSD